MNDLHDVLRKYHWMARIYEVVSKEYNELPEEERKDFRLHIIDTNRRGKCRTVDRAGVQNLDVDLSNMDKEDQVLLRQTHPGRLRIETALGGKLVAQVVLLIRFFYC